MRNITRVVIIALMLVGVSKSGVEATHDTPEGQAEFNRFLGAVAVCLSVDGVVIVQRGPDGLTQFECQPKPPSEEAPGLPDPAEPEDKS